MIKKIKGFTLLELLITIGIIALLATVVFVALSGTNTRARDAARLADLNTLGRYLQSVGQSIGNYLPSSLPTEGDLQVLIDEAESQSGFNLFRQEPRDPAAQTGESGYRYIISGGDIVIFANLDNPETEVDLSFTEPTPAGGSGVFQGTGEWADGWNGTDKYFQVSN